MRRLLLLVSLAFVGSLFLAPSAVAQEEEMEPPQEGRPSLYRKR